MKVKKALAAIAGIGIIVCTICIGVSAQPVGYKSATHPFLAENAKRSNNVNSTSHLITTANGTVNWYGKGANTINASLMLPGETWLATDAGECIWILLQRQCGTTPRSCRTNVLSA